MLANLPSYFSPRVPYDNPLTDQRARGLLIYLGISFILAVMASIYLAFLLFGAEGGLSNFNPALIPGILSPIFVLMFFQGVRYGYYQASAYGIIGLTLISLLSFWNSEPGSVVIVAFALPIVTSGLLLGWRTTLAVFLIDIAIASGPFLIVNSAPDEFFLLILILLIINTLMITFGSNLQATAIRFIDELSKLQRVMDRANKLANESDENRVAIDTINIMRDQLGFTFARLYVVEDNEIIHRIQTGLNQTQINVDTDIQFGQRSAIYEAIRNRAVITILENDDPLVRQHLLTGTRAALAVPVMNQAGDIIAILDIQSEDLSDFHPTEIKSVEMVATQLGQAIEKSRLIDELRRDLMEQDELLRRQRERLLHYEQAERQSTTNTWRDYLQEQGVEYLGYDISDETGNPVEASTLSDEIQTAIQTGAISIEESDNQQIVSVPIQLRGQTLGAMSFRVPIGSQVVGARQQELINNVVQRLSLALENKRLFEQSRTRAQRESKANEVGSLLLSSTDINTVLQLAARNFNEALGAVQTQIRLKPEAREIGESEVGS